MPSRLTPFIGWVSAALVVAVILAPGPSVHAQALEPRSYANTPVGINFVLLGYGYTEGDVSFDASTPIKDAKVHVHAGLLAYARSLDVGAVREGPRGAPRCRGVGQRKGCGTGTGSPGVRARRPAAPRLPQRLRGP